MASSGRPLSPEMKRVIVTLKAYFDRNKADLTEFASAQLTADALELNRVTVDRVMRDYRRDPNSIDNPQKMRGKPSYAVDASAIAGEEKSLGKTLLKKRLFQMPLRSTFRGR